MVPRPRDIDFRTVLETNTPIAEIVTKGVEDACIAYKRTLLKFVDPSIMYWLDHIMTKLAETGPNKQSIERSTNDRIYTVGRSLADLCIYAWVYETLLSLRT